MRFEENVYSFANGVDLTTRQLKSLKRFDTGYVESEGDLPGIGDKTYSLLLQYGLIERATCSTYGTVGHKITEMGMHVLQEAFDKRYPLR